MSRQATGHVGETLAANYLKAHGYTILNLNWRCDQPKGEIDIVARDGETLVFVEVRSRHSPTTETAFASITPRKQAKLVRTVELYLQLHNLNDQAWRIDVIAVALPRGAQPIIDHVENALDW